eukprot:1988128-Prymnesium_polylepis.1
MADGLWCAVRRSSSAMRLFGASGTRYMMMRGLIGSRRVPFRVYSHWLCNSVMALLAGPHVAAASAVGDARRRAPLRRAGGRGAAAARLR